MAEPAPLDQLVHAPLRLAALTILSEVEEAEFTWLRDRLGATDGNLSVHLSKLEQAGYVTSTKTFVDRKPRTTVRLTATGRAAFVRYLGALRTLLGRHLAPRTAD